MHYNAIKSGADILDKLVRKCTCTRLTRRWPLKLFLNLIDVACVNASYWQQKKINRRRLCLLSLGEEMVTPHIRRRAYSGNVNRNTLRVMRAMGVTCKQPASPTTVKKDGGRPVGRCSICPTAKDRKTDWKCCQFSGRLCNGYSIKTIQMACDNCKE